MVIPEQNRIYYTEQVVYLPHSYMPTDGTRAIAENTPTRSEAGLPETGFVFACHNTLHKIGPEMFSVWMRLLRTVEGSVLWLTSPEPSATGNLLREAKAKGVAPERLVFAPRLPQIEDHLARLHLAGLFLDTLPYNAHATACDALWAGLPVLTCTGNTFAGRVAASLLQAIGLKELITASLDEYEELARALACDPQRLAAVREKLLRNRQTEPLFDTARYTRDLESAFITMWQRTQRGEPPESFVVTDAPDLDPHDPSTNGQSSVTNSQAFYDPLATPDFFPTKIDVRRNIIEFALMSRDTFRRSAFLDRRIVRAGRTTLMAEIPKLLTRQAGQPLQFILHVAFCGSTLLARYLETLPHCLVLKEPGVLGQLSTLKNTIPTPADRQLWAKWFSVTMALLSRGYPEDLAVVIKAGDICNWMGSLFLNYNESTKIVFLFIPLPTFLLQALKADHRRQWIREHMQVLRWSMAKVPFLSEISAADLKDGQCAAAMWLLNAFICHSLLQRPDPHRNPGS